MEAQESEDKCLSNQVLVKVEEYEVVEEIVSSSEDNEEEDGGPPAKRRKEEYPEGTSSCTGVITVKDLSTTVGLEDINSSSDEEEPVCSSKPNSDARLEEDLEDIGSSSGDENLEKSLSPKKSLLKDKASTEKVDNLLEEISSSSEPEECDRDNAKPGSSQNQHAQPLLDEKAEKARNEVDIRALVESLEKEPDYRSICLFCFRVGHVSVNCEDRQSKPRRLTKYWLQGKMQREFIFYEYHPEVKEREQNRIQAKRQRTRRNRARRQREEMERKGEEAREQQIKKLETVQELLEMARKLMD